jgi:hypothetical protein
MATTSRACGDAPDLPDGQIIGNFYSLLEKSTRQAAQGRYKKFDSGIDLSVN